MLFQILPLLFLCPCSENAGLPFASKTVSLTRGAQTHKSTEVPLRSLFSRSGPGIKDEVLMERVSRLLASRPSTTHLCQRPPALLVKAQALCIPTAASQCIYSQLSKGHCRRFLLLWPLPIEHISTPPHIAQQQRRLAKQTCQSQGCWFPPPPYGTRPRGHLFTREGGSMLNSP